jgi:hypothetical protein
MKLNFCTLFDSNYFSRGIAMYNSLLEHDLDFHLYIFAFDSLCEETLRNMNLRNVAIISLHDFEDAELLEAKSNRTRTEYCWTCTSSTILYCLEKFNLPNCTYIDADLFFYQSPEILIHEKPEEYHVIITSHNYTSYYDQSKRSGKYCVQFMYFDNHPESLQVLKWWRERCLEWCYNRIEDGKFGDQKYLDDWTSRFDCVWELKNPGGGLAPWNIQQYRFEDSSGGQEIKTGKYVVPVFYHFHGVKFYDNGKVIFSPNTYYLSSAVKRVFYKPYIENLHQARLLIQKFNNTFDPHGSLPGSSYFLDRHVKGKLNYFFCNFIKRIFN